MIQFLAIQNTYTDLQIALWRDSTCLGTTQISKMTASKEAILALQTLLETHSILLKDLSFIAANQGPGPFTTLRVVISTINGLSFAAKIPLIGVNGIEAFLEEYASQPYQNKVVLLNAFGRDLYFGIQSHNGYTNSGCGSIQNVILEIAEKIPHDPILFLGNGIQQCVAEINATFENRAAFLSPDPQTVSLAQIALSGLHQWNKQKAVSYQLQPLYFKEAFSHS